MADDEQKRRKICVDMLQKLEIHDLDKRQIFSNEDMFHTNGKLSRTKVCTQRVKDPYATAENE